MSFDFDNNVPIYLQLVRELKISIISGKVKPGERLKSVRELALVMKVNPNTMQKALSELESMKLIYTERTNGKFVTTDEELIKKYKDEYANELANDFFSSMKSIGIGYKDTIKYLRKFGDE